MRLADVLRDEGAAEPLRIWFCQVLHLAYIDGDESPGARVGLPRFCQEEVGHRYCGWLRIMEDPDE